MDDPSGPVVGIGPDFLNLGNQERPMPYMEVKVFKDEFSRGQWKPPISKITGATAEVTSEKLRVATWVIIDELKDGRWRVGGNPL